MAQAGRFRSTARLRPHAGYESDPTGASASVPSEWLLAPRGASVHSDQGRAAIVCAAKRWSSAEVLAVEIADATGQGGEQLVGERRHLIEHAHEVALVEQQQEAIGFAHHCGCTRAVIEQ